MVGGPGKSALFATMHLVWSEISKMLREEECLLHALNIRPRDLMVLFINAFSLDNNNNS